MTELPPHVGPERQGMAQYMLDCAYTGVAADGPLCGRPATTHVQFRNGRGDAFASVACDEHAGYARTYGIVDEHPTAGSACCMPGSLWFDGPPSRCVIDDSGTRSELTANRELVMTR